MIKLQYFRLNFMHTISINKIYGLIMKYRLTKFMIVLDVRFSKIAKYRVFVWYKPFIQRVAKVCCQCLPIFLPIFLNRKLSLKQHILKRKSASNRHNFGRILTEERFVLPHMYACPKNT